MSKRVHDEPLMGSKHPPDAMAARYWPATTAQARRMDELATLVGGSVPRRLNRAQADSLIAAWGAR